MTDRIREVRHRQRENTARDRVTKTAVIHAYTAIAPTGGTAMPCIKTRAAAAAATDGGQRTRAVPAVGSCASRTPRSRREIRPTDERPAVAKEEERAPPPTVLHALCPHTGAGHRCRRHHHPFRAKVAVALNRATVVAIAAVGHQCAVQWSVDRCFWSDGGDSRPLIHGYLTTVVAGTGQRSS